MEKKKTVKDFTIIYGKQFTDLLSGIIQRGIKDIDEAPFENDQARLHAKTVLAKTHLEVIMALGMCNPTAAEVKEIMEDALTSGLFDEEDDEDYEDIDIGDNDFLKLFS